VGGMGLHSKGGMRWELPIGQNLAIVPAIKLIIGKKHFDVWGGCTCSKDWGWGGYSSY